MKLILKMKLLKVYLNQNQCCNEYFFFSYNSEQIKNFNKKYQEIDNSTEILQGHDDKPSSGKQSDLGHFLKVSR